MAQKLLVLGATGGTGRHIVREALDASYEVTAFVRNSAHKLPAHQRLTIMIGGVVDDPLGLARAMQGQDVVISALGRGQSLKSTNLIQRSVPPILAGMKTHGIRRLIFTSAIGVGETIRDAPLFSRIVIRVLLSNIYADKVAGEAEILRSDLDWTLVQPAQLTNGPLTRTYRAGERLALSGNPKVSRADTAHFIVRQVGDPSYIRKTVLIAY